MAPIFFLFLVTHALLIGAGILMHAGNVPVIVDQATTGFQTGFGMMGLVGMVALFARAYSMGGGTYTGIEAVSNGIPIMREPRVHTAKRTMVYMAVSLSITAAGLLICYLLWDIAPEPGKTMNAVLAYRVVGNMPGGEVFVVLAMFSAGALLVVAAQAGFIDGPRVLANMAVDSWVPRHFSTLSERLTTQNGIIVMGAASLAIVLYTRGNIHSLIVMYSINVFLTFSLSMFGMLKMWIKRHGQKGWIGHTSLFTVGFLLCATVLTITTAEKFMEGGWLTVVITGVLVVLCMIIRRHYNNVAAKINLLNRDLSDIPEEPLASQRADLDPRQPTAGVLVAGYGGLGVHTVLNVLKSFPGQFHNLVFLSVGVVDSGEMKGSEQLLDLERSYGEIAEAICGAGGAIGRAGNVSDVGWDRCRRRCAHSVRRDRQGVFANYFLCGAVGFSTRIVVYASVTQPDGIFTAKAVDLGRANYGCDADSSTMTGNISLALHSNVPILGVFVRAY